MKHSNTRMYLTYIAIVFTAYLLVSLIITIIGGHEYRAVLCHPAQIAGFVILYLWSPLPIIQDMDEENNAIANLKTRR